MRKLGFAGASMTDGLLKELARRLQARPVRQSLRLVGDLHLHHRPERAGQARLRRPRRHQPAHPRGQARRRDRPTTSPPSARKARSSRCWRATRPSKAIGGGRMPNAKALRQGWYFTGDTGYFDADGDLFVTGRVDDMIITGGENVSPVEIESCLSLHPAVSEVAVVGLPDERWGKIVAAFIKRRGPVDGRRSRRSSAAARASPISSARAATCSSTTSRNLRSASSCAASWSRANIERGRQTTLTRNRSMTPMTFDDPRLADARRLSRRDRPPTSERADIILRSPAAQRDRDAAARPAAARVRGARRGRARARDRAARRSASISPAAATSRAFMEASPEHVSKLAWNIAAPARCSKPVIAANRGYCFGVGFEISLACDFRIVSETCFYALPEQKLGQIPGSGGSARLQKIVGITRTKDIVMRSQAHPRQAGATNGASPPNACPTPSSKRRPTRWSTSCWAFSPLAQRTAKKLLNDTEDCDAVDRDRAGRPLLQPAAAIRRFPRRRRSVPRQAAGDIQRHLNSRQGWPSAAANDAKGGNDMKHYRMTIMAALLAATAMGAA